MSDPKDSASSTPPAPPPSQPNPVANVLITPVRPPLQTTMESYHEPLPSKNNLLKDDFWE